MADQLPDLGSTLPNGRTSRLNSREHEPRGNRSAGGHARHGGSDDPHSGTSLEALLSAGWSIKRGHLQRLDANRDLEPLPEGRVIRVPNLQRGSRDSRSSALRQRWPFMKSAPAFPIHSESLPEASRATARLLGQGGLDGWRQRRAARSDGGNLSIAPDQQREWN